jgi:predicted nucleic acid-binding OB-fold protein
MSDIKREYTINDFLKDKLKREDEIEELYEKRESINEEIQDKEEKYKLFVDGYLFKNGLQIRDFKEDYGE